LRRPGEDKRCMNAKSQNHIKHFLKYFFLILGAVFLFVLIRKVGWNFLVIELKRMGWGFWFCMIIHAIEEAFITSAWQVSFPDKPKFSWWKLYGISWIGYAIRQIYQTGDFGAITTKVVMVKNEISAYKGIASVLIFTLSDAVALVLFVSIGIVFMLKEMDVSESFKIALFISFSLLTLLIFIFLIVQRYGLFGSLIGFSQKIPIPENIKIGLLENTNCLDDSIKSYHQSKNGYFWTAVGLNFLRRFFSLTKIQLVLSLLGVSGGFKRCFFIIVFSSLVDSFFFFIPGRMGAQEGGKVFIAKTLGMTTAQGLTLGIVSRITDIVWAILGFGLLLMWKDQSLHLQRAEK
jgi:hypothetical protein